MRLKSLKACLIALAACSCMGIASSSWAQCANYTVSSGTVAYQTATTDSGSNGDDVNTTFAIPFPITFYGTTYSTGATINLGSNGWIDFANPHTGYYSNVCLPAIRGSTDTTGNFGPTMFVWWDDQYTTNSNGKGIFTAVTGVTPSRQLIIEWRAATSSAGTISNKYEVIFSEGSNDFDFVYGTPLGSSASATVGVQSNGAIGATFTQIICNAAGGPAAGTSRHFTCVAPSTGACCDITGACALIASVSCASPSLYAGAGTTCNAAAPLCPIAGIGSCCDVTTAACTYVSSAASCASPSTYAAGGVCTPNSCAPVGSCCVNSSCTTTLPANCTGLFAGPNTTCTTNPCPPPGNDNCNLPMPAPYHFTANFTVSGDATTATSDGSFAGIAGGTFGCNPTNTSAASNSGKEVYFSFTPSANGTLNADLCSTVPSTDSVLSIHTGCPATAANTIGCNDDGACSAGVGLSQVVGVPVTAGTPYLIRVAHYGTASTTAYVYTLQVTTAAIGACCKPDASCIVATSAACTGAPNNGSYGGNATTCGAVTCTGACCDNTTAVCTATAANACTGVYSGIGSSCSPSPCIGQACCSTSTGACTLVGNSGTCAAGSVSAGANTTCVPSPCTISTCCAASGACTVTGSDPCPSGTTPNAATACTPTNPCPQPPPPANDLCTNAQVLTLNVAATGSNVTATGDATEGTAPACQPSFGKSVWFKFTAPSTDVFGFTACGSDYDTVLSVFDGTCGALGTEVGCDDDGCDGITPAGSTLASIIAPVALTAGQTYLVRLAGYNTVPATGNYTLTVTGTAPTGVCCRGATCTTTVASAAACTGSLVAGQTAGASFPAGAACNAGGSNTTPCCYADYNKVNGVGVQDIFDFLADWFAGSNYANTGGNGGPAALAVQNIFDFLTAWFAGGC